MKIMKGCYSECFIVVVCFTTKVIQTHHWFKKREQ